MERCLQLQRCVAASRDPAHNPAKSYANRTYTVDSPGSYTRYRLFVTADNYNNATYPITLVSIAELQLFGY